LRDHVDFVMDQWRKECPELDVSSMAVSSRVFRLSTLAAHDVERRYKTHGLNHGEFDVLATLYRSGPPYALNPQRLIGAMLLSSGAMTHRLDRLEAGKFIERRANPEDRRSVLVSLTAAGLATIKRALADYVDDLDRLLLPLEAGERATLAGLLRKLLAGHDSQQRGGLQP
jgi:DNA-binding MarR family transcriptional regulator